ncbi:MAG TPA: hypothetical protein VGJ22_12120 [Anaerolineales bacterium]
MKHLYSAPSIDDLIRLLKAWRFWVLAAGIGALLGAVLYVTLPPPYRARATVLVDFNLEQAWPQDTDRQQFYYLEREARKLEEIAWSDAVMRAVEEADGHATVDALRDHVLHLSQPAQGGWHFYAEDSDPERAQALASAWAQTFADAARENIAASQGLNSFIEITVTQASGLPTARSRPVSAYMLAGTALASFLAAFWSLFFAFERPRQPGSSKRKSASKANRQKSKSASKANQQESKSAR